MKLKVCGLNDPENIRKIAACVPDFMGFVFYERSPRYAGKMNASAFINDIPLQIKKVGVFVNASLEQIMARAKEFKLDYAQLHGDESKEFCAEVKENGMGVIKVFSADFSTDLSKVNSFAGVSDFFLFDTKTQSHGGSGIRFDWRVLDNWQFSRPVFLSGGIALADIGRIQREMQNIYAVDINSRFEITPGIKDVQQIRSAKQLIEKNDSAKV